MAPLLQADRVVVQRGDRIILDGVTLGLSAGDRTGVVGRNGAGKSSLLAVLAGSVTPASGRVVVAGGVRVLSVGQEDDLPVGPVLSAVVGAADTHEWASIPRVREVVAGLLGGVDSPLLAKDTGQVSGGEARRIALARALAGEWDVLLLDEPTNHLDMETILWLAGYLRRLPAGRRAVVVVTHDRWFLDEVTSRTWEVADGQVHSYEGGYAAYVLAKAERERQDAASASRQRNLLRKELAWLRRGPPARTSKPKFRMDAANALIADEPVARDPLRLRSVASARLGKKVLELEGVSLRPAPNVPPVIGELTWGLGPGDRIGILGPNGAGKTTLLRLVVGIDPPPYEGLVDRGTTVRPAILEQRLGHVDTDERVLPWLRRVGERVTVAEGEELTPTQLLEQFGFAPDTGWKRLGDLSGGELRRLLLLRMLLSGPNLIALDEPTNDLDIDTLTVLEDVLDQWPGTLVVVSHDRYFLERVCDDMYVLAGGRLRHLPGGVDQYLAGRQSSSVDEVGGGGAPLGAGGRGGDTRAARKRLAGIERRLATIAGRTDRLHVQMADAARDPDRLTTLISQLDEVEAQREALEDEWLAVSEALD